MYVMVLNILAYAHDALMLLLYYSKTLGRRYSLRTTALGAAAWWVVQSAVRIPVTYFLEDYHVTAGTIAQCVIMAVYLLLFYGSSVVKKLLAYMLLLAVLGIGECATVLLAGSIFEIGSQPLELGSEYTAAGLLIARPISVFCFYTAFQIWNLFRHSSWVRGGRQWLCVLLPVSQVFLFWYINEVYIFGSEPFSIPVLAGIVLGFAADIYMLLIFDLAYERERVEKELRFQKHLHEIEQIRYDRLRASTEEVSRLRHDFQNYLLALRAISPKQERDQSENEPAMVREDKGEERS